MEQSSLRAATIAGAASRTELVVVRWRRGAPHLIPSSTSVRPPRSHQTLCVSSAARCVYLDVLSRAD